MFPVRPVNLVASDICVSYCFWVEIVFGEIDIAMEGFIHETTDSFLAPVVLVSFPTLSLTLLTVAEVLFNCA